MTLLSKIGLAFVGTLAAALALVSWLVYAQLYGSHEFSAADFEDATGHPLPASARILKSESLDWDLHGDHDACALIEVSEADYEHLRGAMRPNPPSDRRPDTSPCSTEMYAAFARYTVLAAEYAAIPGGSFRHWALAAGKPVVMVQYASW